MQKNNYPKQLINRLLHRPPPPPTPLPPQHPPFMPPPSMPPDREPIMYTSIPYIHTLSPAIRKVLQNNNSSVRVTVRSLNNTKRLYPTPKDPVQPLHKYNVVYQLPCQNCHACYVGMTTNNLKKRLSGHQSTINALENQLNQGRQYTDMEIQQLKGKTALIEHCIDHQHRFNLQKPKILDHTFKRSTLPILEMCHISTIPNTVNRRTDTDNLNRSYTNIINTLQISERTLSTSTVRRDTIVPTQTQ